ncbi:osmoprotectant transport system ATP-binding protein [Halolactibacillus halophilus]|uniref:Quaternary amine transport ATP-binding protein n=1 Tax=Halolactibacillus halophilus TaxID=306540 RepID=A0A1I5MYZ3_9BACI|nr:ABC transporter ATP-binding protein [Halolactibacillus halophilus]GEM01130.1 glycine/betaine ABC transporter ATP-binding protein [Halolactibacillus halophilus]SFP14627.1 osmoprotectant transport system ATP-binding protein [Halolactibacillus halophilus]
MIRFENVKKTFPDGTTAIKDSSFDVKEGEFFVIIGPSGCGKTTTLKTINRLIPISDGTIFIQDKKISEYNINKLRWNIGYVLQQIALFPHLTIEENIAIVPELKKWSREDITYRVTELLNMVGLDADKYRKRLPHELSGGEQQRVGVVRALAADPDIILMDEPFSALDPISREKLQNDIQDLQKKIKKTIVFVTHDIREAVKLADRICLMQDGDIIQVGSPEELLYNPANDFVRTFTKSVQQDEDFDIQDLIETTDAKDAPKIPLETSVFELMRHFKTTDTLLITKDNQTLGLLNKETFTDAFINHFEKGAV